VSGQGLELYWRFHEICPSLDEYIVMIDNKTGAFFRFATRLFESEASAPPNPKLLQLTSFLGRYYQIRDDYYNLISDEVSGLFALLFKFRDSLPISNSTLRKRASAMICLKENSLFLSSIFFSIRLRRTVCGVYYFVIRASCPRR
jgi:polyprenyl synthetase